MEVVDVEARAEHRTRHQEAGSDPGRENGNEVPAEGSGHEGGTPNAFRFAAL